MGVQLPLSIDPEPPDPKGRLPQRITPMQPTLGGAAFDDPDYVFEPWWPGTRSIAFVERGRVRLQAEQFGDPLENFPDLAELRSLRDEVLILDGTILVLDRHGTPDSRLLRRRLRDPGFTEGRPAFVAADLLHHGEDSLLAVPYRQRRERLQKLLRGVESWIASRGFAGEGKTVADAMAEMGMEAISARRLTAAYRSGPAGDAWFRLPIVDTRPPGVRPTLSVIQKLPL